MRNGEWLHRPRTILVDSQELESGDALKPEFRQVAAAEIEEFTADYLRRFPGRSADDVADAEILRVVMNTVGKKDKLGEPVRCVVSVSMLTEGWDASTITHILGCARVRHPAAVRAGGGTRPAAPLLCGG